MKCEETYFWICTLAKRWQCCSTESPISFLLVAHTRAHTHTTLEQLSSFHIPSNECFLIWLLKIYHLLSVIVIFIWFLNQYGMLKPEWVVFMKLDQNSRVPFISIPNVVSSPFFIIYSFFFNHMTPNSFCDDVNIVNSRRSSLLAKPRYMFVNSTIGFSKLIRTFKDSPTFFLNHTD